MKNRLRDCCQPLQHPSGPVSNSPLTNNFVPSGYVHSQQYRKQSGPNSDGCRLRQIAAKPSKYEGESKISAMFITLCRVPTRPGKPGKMRVHLEISWNFEHFNKYHGKMTRNLEKLGGY